MAEIVGLLLIGWYVWSAVMSMLHAPGWSKRERMGYRLGITVQALLVVPAMWYLMVT